MLTETCKNLNQRPIFIVGFPRSGTTLLQSLICTQGIVSFPETHYFRLINNPHLRRSYHKLLEAIFHYTELKINVPLVKKLEKLYNKKKFPLKEVYECIVSQLLQQLNQDTQNRWLEKTPSHIGYMNEISKCYPNAKFIAIIRNPVKAISSYKLNLNETNKFSTYFLISRWKKEHEMLESFEKENSEKIIIVKYEDVVNQTKEIIISLCRFLGIAPNTSKISNYKKNLDTFILPKENWKRKNFQEIKPQKSRVDLSIIDRLSIKFILRRELKKYNYSSRFKLLYFLYPKYHFHYFKRFFK